jgi:hypothetical protein
MILPNSVKENLELAIAHSGNASEIGQFQFG